MTDCRKIIHIDMDAFYASVEQRDNPHFRGKPLAVGGGEERGVVAAASYEARKYGVRSAMPGKQARKLCTELLFVKPRFEVYKRVSYQIREIFHEFTTLVEPLSLDEAYLDVTHPLKGKNSATLIANEIRQRIWKDTGLTASAGISYNKFLAKIASDVNKPNGFFVIHPKDAAGFIEKLPIERFHGVGKVTAQRFQKLGIHNGLDLKNAGVEFVLKHFGKNGLFFYDIAHGIDRRSVEPDRDRKSAGAENTFDRDLKDVPELNAAMADICNTLYYRLEKAGIWGSTITIKIKYHDFRQVTRSKTFSQPVTSKQEITQIATALLHEHREPDCPIRLLGVTFSQLETDQSLPGKQLKIPFPEKHKKQQE
ncbi:MAG: DNA polymerase IV [Bacteroidota bacterium]